MQRKQLERSQADQEMLINRLQKVEKKLIKTRKELNRVTDENDDLKMKFAFKQYETISSIVKMSVATQTTFRLVRKKNPANNNIQNDEKGNENQNNNTENSNNNNNENNNVKENEINNNDNQDSNLNTSEKEEIKNDNLNASEKVDNKNEKNQNQNDKIPSKQNNNKKETNIPLGSKSSNLHNSSKLLNSEIDLTEMEWVEEEEEENDAYNESGVFSTDNPFNGSSKSDMMDDLFIEVHQPLLLTNRDKKKTNRNKLFMLSDPRQKKKSPKILNTQKKIIIPKADAGQLLTIGFDEKHPYRPNSSMSNDSAKERKRPFTSSVNPPNYANIISQQQQPDLSVSATRMNVNTPDAARVNSTRTINSIYSSFGNNNKGVNGRIPPKIPSLSSDLPQRPTTTASGMMYKNVSGNEEESFDTLRITNIQFAQQNDGKDVSRSPPIVDISSRTTINGPLVTFSKNVRTSKSTGNE